jgi:hypothetical protein
MDHNTKSRAAEKDIKEDRKIFAVFHGRVEIPKEPNFVEKVAESLKVDLSPTQLTTVKWLAFENVYYPDCRDFGVGWRDVMYTELDSERITDFIMHVKTAHSEKDPVPKWYRDYHEFGVRKVKSPYDDAYSSSDEEDGKESA